MKTLLTIALMTLATSTYAHNFTCSTEGNGIGLQFTLQTNAVEQEREDLAEYGPLLEVKVVNARIMLGNYPVALGVLESGSSDYYKEDLVEGSDFTNDNFLITLKISEAEFAKMARKSAFKGQVVIPAPYTNEDVEKSFNCR